MVFATNGSFIVIKELEQTSVALVSCGSNQGDKLNDQPNINPKAIQEAISEGIFHPSDCSKLSY
jgi:hypothetical protein